ncbi:hypothetical protein C8R45DRAFT_427312 [Mycena sanguinolenta]|nr:hypothetical protein C8R45DRAFT_427312 [Mycena sanguinolenta]
MPSEDSRRGDTSGNGERATGDSATAPVQSGSGRPQMHGGIGGPGGRGREQGGDGGAGQGPRLMDEHAQMFDTWGGTGGAAGDGDIAGKAGIGERPNVGKRLLSPGQKVPKMTLETFFQDNELDMEVFQILKANGFSSLRGLGHASGWDLIDLGLSIGHLREVEAALNDLVTQK